MCQDEQEYEPVPIDYNKIQLVKRGGRIEIFEFEDTEETDDEGNPIYSSSEVYQGGPDLDCILECLSLHFGYEGVQTHELEDNSADPLEIHKSDSLDNRDEDDQEREPTPAEIVPDDRGDTREDPVHEAMGDPKDPDDEVIDINVYLPGSACGQPLSGESDDTDEWEDDDQ